MKKFMLGMIVLSVMVFGAEMKVVEKAKPVVKINPTNWKALIKGAKEVKFVETETAQIVIKIPIDIDNVPAGIEVKLAGKSYHTTSEQEIRCHLFGGSEGYYARKIVQAGQSTIKMKFNGIPIDSLVKLNEYYCWLAYEVNPAGSIATGSFPDELYETKKAAVEGSL